jgi:hypothetical protein
LLEQLVIGRWMSLPCFLICCIPLEQDGKVKTNVDGSPLKRGCSLLAPFISSLFVMVAFLFLGRVFGGPRFL